MLFQYLNLQKDLSSSQNMFTIHICYFNHNLKPLHIIIIIITDIILIVDKQ